LKEKRNSKPHGTTDISRLVVEKTSDILSPSRITPRKCEFLFTNRKSKRHSEFPAVSGAHPTQKKNKILTLTESHDVINLFMKANLL
jgi:hypothetical protein